MGIVELCLTNSVLFFVLGFKKGYLLTNMTGTPLKEKVCVGVYRDGRGLGWIINSVVDEVELVPKRKPTSIRRQDIFVSGLKAKFFLSRVFINLRKNSIQCSF